VVLVRVLLSQGVPAGTTSSFTIGWPRYRRSGVVCVADGAMARVLEGCPAGVNASGPARCVPTGSCSTGTAKPFGRDGPQLVHISEA
jgi:hypothetical protein